MKVDSLSAVERLLLINQFRLLELLAGKESEYYSKARSILEGGYTLLYGDIFEGISNEMSLPECNYVSDVLEMHQSMRDSFNDLTDKEDLSLTDIGFRGFDGNNERKEQVFALFLKQNGLWKNTTSAPGTPEDLNSHFPTAARYREMLDKWLQLKDERHHMTAAQIKGIIPYWKAQKQ